MAGLIILAVSAILAAVILAWKLWKLRQEVYQFSDCLEKNLDHMVNGREMEDTGETEDSLWGKINEKLRRTAHIWERKGKESAEEKKRMKELVSDISHQTRTPIANQKIYLELMRQEPMTQEGREFLEKMENQTDKLDFLMQSMVKMSRLETGIITIWKQEADLVKTLEQAVAAIVPAASKKRIELSARCGGRLLIPHDPKWTVEAIFNILDNAVKYTQECGRVHLTVSRQEIFTKINIRDSGKGIALERQAQIFTRFYREPEVHGQEGIGIGLYLARRIAELQDGYIEVRSEPGQGSDFQIYLPNA